MNIQEGTYGNFQKVLDENGNEVWRQVQGGCAGDVDLSAIPGTIAGTCDESSTVA